jgi:hypothetical protein
MTVVAKLGAAGKHLPQAQKTTCISNPPQGLSTQFSCQIVFLSIFSGDTKTTGIFSDRKMGIFVRQLPRTVVHQRIFHISGQTLAALTRAWGGGRGQGLATA